jgi:dCMP deaminase
MPELSPPPADAPTPDSTILVMYLPVLHRGYLDFLKKYQGSVVYLLGDGFKEQFKPLKKDIRALSAAEAKSFLESLQWFFQVEILSPKSLSELATTWQADEKLEIVMPDESELRELAEEYGLTEQVEFIPTFLRWDKNQTLAEQALEDLPSTNDPQHLRWMHRAQELASTSQDIWRQVGCVVVKDGQELFSATNRHVPDAQQPVYDGDPRGNFSKGQHQELTTAFHVEAQCIAAAAKHGVSLAGSAIYVTTFPCPACAKLIAYSGVKELYFADGYGMLDGQKILESQGVKLQRVTVNRST